MALNAAILTSDNSISLYEGEKIFCTSKGVRLYLETGGGYPGVGATYYAEKGTLILTNMRVVYVVTPPQYHLKNIDIPLGNLKEVVLKDASFFSYAEVKGLVVPVTGGGLSALGDLKLTFVEGGAGEFHGLLSYAETLRIGGAGPASRNQEQLPVYTEGASSQTPAAAPPNYSSDEN